MPIAHVKLTASVGRFKVVECSGIKYIYGNVSFEQGRLHDIDHREATMDRPLLGLFSLLVYLFKEARVTCSC